MRAPAPPVPVDALVFKFPRGLWSFMFFAVALFLVWVAGAVVWILEGPSGPTLAFLSLGIVFFAGLAFLALRSSARLRDRVAVSPEGLWYLPRKAEPTFIPWGDVARVEAHDTAQRLVLVDARDGTKIRLEYQLKDFDKLREFVLGHVSSPARFPATIPSVFHRTWINKGVFVAFAAIFLFVAYLSWSQRQPVPSLGFVAFACLNLAMVARDPTRLVIDRNGVALKYLGWERTIPFSAVSGIALTDVRARGNAWAAVMIERDRGKPIRLFRFREGSIALHDALRSAWISAGGRDDRGARSG